MNQYHLMNAIREVKKQARIADRLGVDLCEARKQTVDLVAQAGQLRGRRGDKRPPATPGTRVGNALNLLG